MSKKRSGKAKGRGLPALEAEKNFKFKTIDYNRILKITPNELYRAWEYNRKEVEAYISKYRTELIYLDRVLQSATSRKEREEIGRRGEYCRHQIDLLDKSFKEWSQGVQLRINSTVKHIFNKLFNGLSEDEIEILTNEFEDEFGKSENADVILEQIVIKYINNKRQNMMAIVAQNNAQELQRRNQIIAQQNNVEELEVRRRNENGMINNQYYNHQYNPNIENYEQNTPIQQQYEQRNGSGRSFGISIYYSSFGDGRKDKQKGLINESFLNALDAMSNMLYGSIQTSLSELYKMNDEYKDE